MARPEVHDRSARSDSLAVQVEQPWNLCPAHAAFRADAPGVAVARAGRQGSVDEAHLIIGGARCLIRRVIEIVRYL
jgi:hypothetical protein